MCTVNHSMIQLGDQLLNNSNFQHNLLIKNLEIEIRFGTLRKRQLFGQNVVYGIMSSQDFLVMTPLSVQQINSATSLKDINKINFDQLKSMYQPNQEERMQQFDAMTDESTFKHVKRTLDNLKNTDHNSYFGVVHFLQYSFQQKGCPYTLRKRYLLDEAAFAYGNDGRGKLLESVVKFSLNKLDVCNGQLRTDYRLAQSVEIQLEEDEFDETQHGVEVSERERYTYHFKFDNIFMIYDLTVIKPDQKSYSDYQYSVELEFKAVDGQYNQQIINRVITEADAMALLMQDYLQVEYAEEEQPSSATYDESTPQSF